MKKVLITIGSISLAFGLYMLSKGNPFMDQISLFVNSVILLGCAFIDFEKQSCKTKN